MARRKRLDRWSTATIAVTAALFGVSLWVTGLTHDLLLEVGVLLVSIKLILNAQKADMHAEEIGERLRGLEELLRADRATRDGGPEKGA